MHQFTVETTRKKQIVDITDEINAKLAKGDLKSGLCNLFVLHTTACITTADLDPGTDLDMLDAFEAMMPKLHYRHPHNPAHVGDHIMSSIIGPSVLLPFQNKELILGTWQRIVLVELDGPRPRKIVFSLLEDR